MMTADTFLLSGFTRAREPVCAQVLSELRRGSADAWLHEPASAARARLLSHRVV